MDDATKQPRRSAKQYERFLAEYPNLPGFIRDAWFDSATHRQDCTCADCILRHPSRLKEAAREVYPIARNWRRKLWPLIQTPELQDTLRRAIRVIRSDFDPAIHIPREAGKNPDFGRPRTRECVKAFQMPRYCHVIVAPMLHLCQLAFPEEEWAIFNAEWHSVVASKSGIIFDIGASDDPPDETLKRVRRDCFRTYHDFWTCYDDYIENLIEEQPFGPAVKMSASLPPEVQPAGFSDPLLASS